MSRAATVRPAVLAAGIIAALCASSDASETHEFTEELTAHGRDVIAPLLTDPVVISALREQNRDHVRIGQEEIDALDAQWEAELDSDTRPLIEEVLSRPVSDYLAGIQEGAEGVYTEMFLMDAVGLNAGQSTLTSDFWQGDEAKWQESFGAGADAIHIGAIEYDESSQVFQSQISLPVIDPDNRRPIGAITVGIDLWYLD